MRGTLCSTLIARTSEIIYCNSSQYIIWILYKWSWKYFVSVLTDPSTRQPLGLQQDPNSSSLGYNMPSQFWCQTLGFGHSPLKRFKHHLFYVSRLIHHRHSYRMHSACRGVKGLPCTVSHLIWLLYDALLRLLELWPKTDWLHASITHSHPVIETRIC